MRAKFTPSWAQTAPANPPSPTPCSPLLNTNWCRVKIFFHGEEITEWPTDARAKAGIFLGFKYPQEIAGVSVIQFLRQALSARKGIDLSILELRLSAMSWMKRLGMDSTFVDRYLNEGFPVAKRSATKSCRWQFLNQKLPFLTKPTLVSTLTHCASLLPAFAKFAKNDQQMGIVLITHYQRLLDELQPDFVHIMVDGRIVKSGGMEIAEELEKSGYEAYKD
jgi:Fe-S cluster assembly ATP-binding protein